MGQDCCKLLLRGLAAFFVVLVCIAPALGQGAGTASLSGTVTDPHGAAVSGAKVIIHNVETGLERVLATNEQGFYAAPLLQPGTYDVRVSQAGFAELLRKNIGLAVGQTLAIDVQLSVQSAQQSVTVSEEVGVVEPEKTDLSNLITQTQVENLPLNGRRWDNLVLLTPGVSEDGGFGGVSFRGISSLYNNNMVDGADNNQAFFAEARGRTRLPYGYSLDAIKEFQVTNTGYSAEYGRAAGGVVNAITRAGGNAFHGDGFYFVRDAVFLAQDPRSKELGQQKPDERRQQFGGSVGGPLVRDKLFFFLSYDQQKRNFPAVIAPFSTPSYNAQLAGCISANCASVVSALNALTFTTNPRNGDNYIGLGKVDYQLGPNRSEEHTSELQSPCNLVCRLLLEKKKHPASLPVHKSNLASRRSISRERVEDCIYSSFDFLCTPRLCAAVARFSVSLTDPLRCSSP